MSKQGGEAVPIDLQALGWWGLLLLLIRFTPRVVRQARQWLEAQRVACYDEGFVAGCKAATRARSDAPLTLGRAPK